MFSLASVIKEVFEFDMCCYCGHRLYFIKRVVALYCIKRKGYIFEVFKNHSRDANFFMQREKITVKFCST